MYLSKQTMALTRMVDKIQQPSEELELITTTATNSKGLNDQIVALNARMKKIQGLEPYDPLVFHAGTAFKDGSYITAGGRVLGVTALGETLKSAVEEAYGKISKIYFKGMHFRKDIAYRALERIEK